MAGNRGASGMATLSAARADLRRTERKTVFMLTLDRLRDGIVRGDYPEGMPLRQDALAADLGVSRIPVREALRELEVEGLVSFSPHLGTVVSTLSLAEIKELFELRALIEAEVLRRAIPCMRTDDLVRAQALLDEFGMACVRQDIAAWGTLNKEFHTALLEPAGQPLTLQMLQYLHNQSDRYTRLQLTLTHGESLAHAEHAAILEAVRRRETQHACALLASHILGAGRSLYDFLRQHRGAPVPPASAGG